MGGRGLRAVPVLLCVAAALCVLAPGARASAATARLAAQLAAAAASGDVCAPSSVPPSEQCAYVTAHCPQDGFQALALHMHYCWAPGGGVVGQCVSGLLLALAGLLAFALLLTVSERFFCPALELISDYLQLPPVVAGATLLSFGNGAPDTFTQVAAVQGGGAAIGMALSEPLGGGMFATNVVFGLVVLIAHRQQVLMQRVSFIKDGVFYLASLLLIGVVLADGKVKLGEAGIMCLAYVAYVAATFYLSRGDEPVHAAAALHEVPLTEAGGVDLADSCSCDDTAEQPERIDATTSVACFDDVEAQAKAAGERELHAPGARVVALLAPQQQHQHQHQHQHQPGGRAAGGSGLAALQVALSWHRQQQHSEPEGLRAPLLLQLPDDRSRAAAGSPAGDDPLVNSDGDTGEGVAAAHVPAAAAAKAANGWRGCGAAGAEPLPPAVLVHGCCDGSCDAAPPSPLLGRREPCNLSSSSGSSGSACLSPFEQQHHAAAGGAAGAGNGAAAAAAPAVQAGLLSPRAAAEGGSLLSPLPSSRHASRLPPLLPAPGSWQLSEGQSGALSPHVVQLQQQHHAEQLELLEQQAAEQLALQLAEEDEQGKASQELSLKHRLQQPLVCALSCTMPRVGTGSGHHYKRWRACLLPLSMPLTWFLAAPELAAWVGWPGLAFGAACAASGGCIIWATFPASEVPRKALKGVFAVLTFVQSIVWLDVSASALVQVCAVFGVIWGLPPALLGATVLAWGNSVPDLINNAALARDGFPSMAVAACFASPLFTLLIGLGSALAYGTVLHGGELPMPVDTPLLVMAAFSVLNIVKHLTLVPFVHRFRMQRSLALWAFAFYAAFNAVYGAAVAGAFGAAPQPQP